MHIKEIRHVDFIHAAKNGPGKKIIIISAIFLFFILSGSGLRAAPVCTPVSAVMCAAVDDVSDIYVNGIYLGTFWYEDVSNTGRFSPSCMTLTAAQLATLNPTGNVIAVHDQNISCCEMWATWTMEITCQGGGYSYVDSDSGAGVDELTDMNTCCADSSGTSLSCDAGPDDGTYTWYNPLYNEASDLSWRPAGTVLYLGHEYGQKINSFETHNVLEPLGYGNVSNGCQQIYFRQGFTLNEIPTPMPPDLTITKSAGQTAGIQGPGDLTFYYSICNSGGGTTSTTFTRDHWTDPTWSYVSPTGSWYDVDSGGIFFGDISFSADNINDNNYVYFEEGIPGVTCTGCPAPCLSFTYVLESSNFPSSEDCKVWYNTVTLASSSSTVKLENFCPSSTETYTYTSTYTRTPTRTYTVTNTQTYTQTSTPTNTPTPTYTDTLTPTETYTYTVTYTYTYTATPTLTQTDTLTMTPTYTQTVTATNTPTYTDTMTMTDTYTRTVTYTYTYTGTPTFTQTDTLTITPTNTQSITSTDTPTITYTLTQTDTYTFTETYTYTDTATPTRTQTETLTITLTNTQSITSTDTPTITYTLTQTDTYTFTETYTQTVTLSITPTDTDTLTQTNTCTYTETYTNTYTDTPTQTRTDTLTATQTNTQTFTLTNTPTYTNTLSSTATYTKTCTYTSTQTLTITRTQTPTYTATMTYTATCASTPTVTITPQVFPYMLTINVYNEAGELVKAITNTVVPSDPQSMELLLNGSQTTLMEPGSGNPLTIMLPGINPVQNPKGGVSYASFQWDGTNSAGQDVANGVYYIQETATDPYGHTTSITKTITAINTALYVQVNIYNSAGELVDTIKSAYDGVSWLMLNIENNSSNGNAYLVGNGNATMTIQYTASNSMTWYGKNAQGDYVASGVYEIQLVAMTAQGLDVVASKTVTLLNEGTQDVLIKLKSYPNPYPGGITTPLTFSWQARAGTIRIKIYNIAGELVRIIAGDLGTGSITWDLKSAGGQSVSCGTYVCVVEGTDSMGDKETKILKLASIAGGQ